MVPSPPVKFTPNIVNFENENQAEVRIESEDGVIQEKDIEGAEIYVNNVKIPYNDPSVKINYQGEEYWLAHETSPKGFIYFLSFTDETASTRKNITADLPITKIIYNDVTYEP